MKSSIESTRFASGDDDENRLHDDKKIERLRTINRMRPTLAHLSGRRSSPTGRLAPAKPFKDRNLRMTFMPKS